MDRPEKSDKKAAWIAYADDLEKALADEKQRTADATTKSKQLQRQLMKRGR